MTHGQLRKSHWAFDVMCLTMALGGATSELGRSGAQGKRGAQRRTKLAGALLGIAAGIGA